MAGITKRERAIRHVTKRVGHTHNLSPVRAERSVRGAAAAITRMSKVRRHALFLLLLENAP